MSVRFPNDLRAWMPATALLRLAQAIAQDNNVEALHPVFSQSAKRFQHPWRMLALLLYAYGSGIWDSRGVAEIAARDPLLIELCRGESPGAEMVRRFRNQNRAVVVRGLEEIVRRAWCHRHPPSLAKTMQLLPIEILCDARARFQRASRCDDAEESLSFAT